MLIDFFLHLNGNWLKRTEIPADKSSWGAFATLRDDVLPQLRGLIEAAGTDRKAGGDGGDQEETGEVHEGGKAGVSWTKKFHRSRAGPCRCRHYCRRPVRCRRRGRG